MKHNSISQVCVLSLLSLSVFGKNPTDRLIGISLNSEDNPRFNKQIVVSDPGLLTSRHPQLNGNLMVKSSEKSKSLYSMQNSNSAENIKSDLTHTEESGQNMNTVSKNVKANSSGHWESPSRTSLMRLHEFLLMEQLMQD